MVLGVVAGRGAGVLQRWKKMVLHEYLVGFPATVGVDIWCSGIGARSLEPLLRF